MLDVVAESGMARAENTPVYITVEGPATANGVLRDVSCSGEIVYAGRGRGRP